MFDLTEARPNAWPERLRRREDANELPEEFGEWWDRNGGTLAHLHPQIAEQWIYRHFDWTWFNFLPLESLEWRHEAWATARLLADIHMERDTFRPQHDYVVFNANGVRTARDFNPNLTWSIPPVLLETPHGVISLDRGPLPAVRFVLIEGHKRLRYLAGTVHAGIESGPHGVFIVRSAILAG